MFLTLSLLMKVWLSPLAGSNYRIDWVHKFGIGLAGINFATISCIRIWFLGIFLIRLTSIPSVYTLWHSHLPFSYDFPNIEQASVELERWCTAWKLWDNDLWPCCCCLPETDPSHMFLCRHPHMQHSCHKLFSQILQWLEDMNTDSILLSLIRSSGIMNILFLTHMLL